MVGYKQKSRGLVVRRLLSRPGTVIICVLSERSLYVWSFRWSGWWSDVAQTSFLCFFQDLIVLRDGLNLLLPQVRRQLRRVSQSGQCWWPVNNVWIFIGLAGGAVCLGCSQASEQLSSFPRIFVFPQSFFAPQESYKQLLVDRSSFHVPVVAVLENNSIAFSGPLDTP